MSTYAQGAALGVDLIVHATYMWCEKDGMVMDRD